MTSVCPPAPPGGGRVTPPTSARRWYGRLALAVAAFVVYGSYVPFDWRWRPWDEATAAFRWTWAHRAVPDSRSDWAANVALGVPLGFALLGWRRLDERNPAVTAAAGAAVVTACTLFAAAVEFGQLFSVRRTCSGSDIWAQGLGALAGVGLWAGGGQWLTDRLRAVLARDAVRASTAVPFAGYAAVVLLAQTLPLDLTASPRDISRRLRDPDIVTRVPFAELAAPADGGKTAADWVRLVAVFLPAGLLASGLPGRLGSAAGWVPAAAVGLGFAAATEGLQVLVVSRHPGVTDAVIGGGGFVLGWTVGRVAAQPRVRRHRGWVATGLWAVWAAVVPTGYEPPTSFAQAVGQPDERLTDVLLFVPLGAAAAWGWGRPAIGAAVGGVVGLFCGSAVGASFGLAGGLIGAIGHRRVARPDPAEGCG